LAETVQQPWQGVFAPEKRQTDNEPSGVWRHAIAGFHLSSSPDHPIYSTMPATTEDIQQLVDRIATEFGPQRIILFGSRAYGHPRPDSDVDLLVLMPIKESPFEQALTILNRLDPPFSVDLIARDPADAERRYKFGDPVIREAFDRGKVMYEAAA
jgi:predicted nucleotidyltransferase